MTFTPEKFLASQNYHPLLHIIFEGKGTALFIYLSAKIAPFWNTWLIVLFTFSPIGNTQHFEVISFLSPLSSSGLIAVFRTNLLQSNKSCNVTFWGWWQISPNLEDGHIVFLSTDIAIVCVRAEVMEFPGLSFQLFRPSFSFWVAFTSKSLYPHSMSDPSSEAWLLRNDGLI